MDINSTSYKEIPAIKKAVEKLEILSGDKETIELYKLRKEALEEGNRLLNTARIEGKDEGIKEGIKEGQVTARIEVAISLLDVLDDEMIAKKCNLSLEDVQKIRKENG